MVLAGQVSLKHDSSPFPPSAFRIQPWWCWDLRTCLVLPSAVALGVGDGRTKTQGYRTYCGRAGYPEKGRIGCIFTWFFPWSSIPLVCAASYLCEVVSSGAEKEATCLPGTASLYCHSSLIVVSLHTCVSGIYRHWALDPNSASATSMWLGGSS